MLAISTSRFSVYMYTHTYVHSCVCTTHTHTYTHTHRRARTHYTYRKSPVYRIVPKYPSNRNMADPGQWLASKAVTVIGTRLPVQFTVRIVGSSSCSSTMCRGLIWNFRLRSLAVMGVQCMGRSQDSVSPDVWSVDIHVIRLLRDYKIIAKVY